MRCLFLVPPALDGKPAAERIFGCNYGLYSQANIFLLYPATMLRQAGYPTEYRDYPAAGKGKNEFLRDADSLDHDVVFLSTVFLSAATDLLARDALKARHPHTRFVFFSTQPTATPERFLDSTSVVIRGEPETRVLALLEAFLGKRPLASVPGISFLDGGSPVGTAAPPLLEDLDSLPFPDRSFLRGLDFGNPKLSRSPCTTMVASRGCGYACRFCVPNSQSFAREIEFKRWAEPHGKPPVRLRSAANVVAECASLAREGFRAISFLDDQFIWGKERALAIAEGMQPLGLEWSCLARVDRLQDPEILHAMGRAGCRYIDIGVESFSQAIIDDIGKGYRVEQIGPAVANVKAAGIEPELNILLASSPLETEATIDHTFRELLKLDVDYVLFSICTPFPFTEFNAIARAKGWMIRPEYEPIDPMRESFISYPHLKKPRLDRILRGLNWRFYFRPSYLWKRFRRLSSWRDFLQKARIALTLLAWKRSG
ncbi:MAG: radical SAM protein [Candidatus Riflebacteria bacterium]|nr:radical SAM protein [Candidatus Riflebacteria bacterium]